MNYKSKTYNYWVIYILPKYTKYITAFNPDENDFIYAYTDDINVLENFKSFHDMSKFNVKKYTFNRNDCKILNVKYQTRYLLLVDVVTNKNGKAESIKLSMTIDEKNLLDNTKYSYIWKIGNLWDMMTFGIDEPTINIFNKKYKKILKKFKLHMFMNNRQHVKFDNIFNEFSIYYSLFKKLLK